MRPPLHLSYDYAAAMAFAASLDSVSAHWSPCPYSCARAHVHRSVPCRSDPLACPGERVFSCLPCQNLRETSASLTLHTLQQRPRLLAQQHHSLHVALAPGRLPLILVEHLRTKLTVCLTKELFRSALATILFILKRSDMIAPLPSSAVSVDHVSAENPTQVAVIQTSKTTKMLLLALELASGFLFGSGLVVAGMVNPAKASACVCSQASLIHF